MEKAGVNMGNLPKHIDLFSQHCCSNEVTMGNNLIYHNYLCLLFLRCQEIAVVLINGGL